MRTGERPRAGVLAGRAPRARAARRRTRAPPRACPSRPGRGTGRRATGGRAARRRARRRRADGPRGRSRGMILGVEHADDSSRSRASTAPARRRWSRRDARAGRARARAAGAARARRRRAVRAHPRARQGPGRCDVDPRAEALLYAAARAQLVAEQLVPLLDAAAGCCSTASSTPRSPTRAPGAGSGWRRSARSTRSRPAACARPHAAAADRPGRRPRADRGPRAPTGSSRRARRSSRRSRAPTTSWRRPSRERFASSTPPPPERVLADALAALDVGAQT